MIYFSFLAIVLALWLGLTALSPVVAQADRQKQLMLKSIVERGNTLMAKQMFKEALAEYQKCLDLDPGNVTAVANIVLVHDNWGVYYFRHNQYQDAQAEWETALQLSPNDIKARNNMQVLKNTLARMGVDLNTETELVKEQKKNEKEQSESEQQPSAVIINSHKDKPTEDKNYVNQFYSHEPGAATASRTNQKTIESATPPVTNTQPALVEQQLNRIERKVYGRNLDELPVTKRLEKLETDNFGQVSTGPIMQRLEKLKQLYPD